MLWKECSMSVHGKFINQSILLIIKLIILLIILFIIDSLSLSLSLSLSEGVCDKQCYGALWWQRGNKAIYEIVKVHFIALRYDNLHYNSIYGNMCL